MAEASAFEGILAAARGGADWAWELLIRDLNAPLLAFFRARGAADPENLLGEVYLDVATGLRRFEGDRAGFRAFVFTIARRRLVDDWRRRARRPEEVPPDDGLPVTHHVPSAETEALAAFGGQQVMTLLDALTADQRDVLALRVVVGLSLEETATVLGKRVGAVKALQRRALAALRREIRSQGVSR